MKSQILDLQAACMDNATPVSALLRKALMLAIRLNDGEYRQMFEKELHGYGPDDSVPTYRTADVDVRFCAVHKQTLETVTASEFLSYAADVQDRADAADVQDRADLEKIMRRLFRCELHMPISELENRLEKASEDSRHLLAFELPSAVGRLVALCKYGGSLLGKVYNDSPPPVVQVVPLSELIRIVESIRTTILDWTVKHEQGGGSCIPER